MRWWEWLDAFSESEGERSPFGCMSIIIAVVACLLLFSLNGFLDNIGIDGGLVRLFQLYLYPSFWDMFMVNPPEMSKGLRVTMFASTLVLLMFLSFKFLMNYEESRFRNVKAIIYYGFVGPHLLLLMGRIIFTFI